MKKVLFFIIAMVCAVTGAWAAPTVSQPNYPFQNTVLVQTTEAGTIDANVISTILNQSQSNSGKTILTVSGPINQADIDAITAGIKSGSIRVIDYGGTNVEGLTVTTPTQAVGLRLPISADLTQNYGSNIKYVISSGMTGNMDWSGDTAKGSTEINLHVTAADGISSFMSDYAGNPSFIKFRTIDLSTNVENLDYSALTNNTGVVAVNYPADNTGEEYVTPAADCTDCSINYNSSTNVATVHIVHPGHLTYFFKQIVNQLPSAGGTIFKFDSDCKLNADDLAALAGENITHQNNYNKYYVDLFDIPVANYMDSKETKTIEDVIVGAIDLLRKDNLQFRGLLLPKNPTSVGTTLIQDRAEDQTKQATCSQFIAYNNGTSTVAHVYNADNTATATYNTNVEKLESVLELHPEIGTNTTNYLVTTNSTSKVSMTALPATATKVETINNDMVNPNPDSPAKMYVYPSASGQFDNLVDNTSVKNTAHLDLLELNDAANPDDFTAINSFTHGPRVLDLRNLTSTITKAMLESLTNSNIEFILLPERMANKEDVCEVNYSANMTSLKAVIASTSTTLVAHLAKAGSLVEARGLATGIAAGSTFPDKKGLTSVILSGNLNAADINAQGKVGTDGHWTTSSNQAAGLNQEQATITSIDLEKAVFANQEDMNFYKAGFGGLTNVVLPTSEAMTLIPEDCLNNNQSLKEICIPYNYQIIRSGAFHGTAVEHITTTDANGALIDNGDHTWTLSANITELGSVPSEPGAFVNQVFQHDLLVTDIYILATKTPKCYAGVFPANASYGYGGAQGSDTYCRDKYFNSDDRLSKAWIVLRFPSEESYNAAKKAGQATDATYEQMKANYTDPTRVYTKKEQTGAVDANGDEITWPTRQEANRSYNQGSRGLTWLAWDPTSGTSSQGEEGAIAGGADPIGATVGSKATSEGMPTTTSGYTFDADYMGWHQIALAQATYYEPAERVVNEKIIRDYEATEWYTFCIPYDMNYKQVVEWLGIPKSTDEVETRLNGTKVESDMLPDVRQLVAVHRTAANGSGKNTVKLTLTTNLIEEGSASYLNVDLTTDAVTPMPAQPTNKTYTADTKRMLVGGRPYIIKAYKRKVNLEPGQEDPYKIKGQNLGKMIMTRYADEFESSASVTENGLYEQLGDGDLTTLRFAIPFEHHKILATHTNADKTEGSVYEEDGKKKKYYYTMVGQFWQQPLPQYCLYMSHDRWYRYTNTNLGYTWDPYKCVIMATQELVKEDGDKHYGGGYRRGADDEYTNYPVPETGTTDLLTTDFRLGFLDGRDDDDFTTNGAARYIFSFDDDIVELDENGNEVTAIERLDGETIAPAVSDGKVYNMAGQYVGQSTDGLTKGMYIVNGKKVVIK